MLVAKLACQLSPSLIQNGLVDSSEPGSALGAIFPSSAISALSPLIDSCSLGFLLVIGIGENLVCQSMEIVLSLPVVYFVKQLSDNLHAISNSIDCIDEHMM